MDAEKAKAASKEAEVSALRKNIDEAKVSASNDLEERTFGLQKELAAQTALVAELQHKLTAQADAHQKKLGELEVAAAKDMEDWSAETQQQLKQQTQQQQLSR